MAHNPRLLRLLWVLLLAASACQETGAKPEQTAASVPVTIGRVVRADVPFEVKAIGTIEAVSTVEVVPQVTGRVTRIEFKEGAKVEKNDPLFVIDTRPYNATLAAAQAELHQHEALAEEAKLEAERAQELARQGLSTGQEVTRRQAEMKSTQAAVEAARAQVASASINVNFATIRSPISGRTGRLLVHAGNVVQAAAATPLVTIRTLSPVHVTFTVAQDLLALVRKRFDEGPLVVRATPRGAGSSTSLGTLSFIDNTIDRATGMLTLKASFANEDEGLWPGAFVDVVLVLGVDKQAMVVPEEAVAEGQSGAYAFIIDAQEKAQRRSLTVVRRTETLAVIDKGLAPGERVVLDGLVRLKQGSKVQIRRQASGTGSAKQEGGAP